MEYLTKDEVRKLPIGTVIIVDTEVVRVREYRDLPKLKYKAKLSIPTKRTVEAIEVYYTGYTHEQTYELEYDDGYVLPMSMSKIPSEFVVKAKLRPTGKENKYDGLRVTIAGNA